MSEQKLVAAPQVVEISGDLALQLKEYIGQTPCPNLPVQAAVNLLGGLEVALQTAAAKELQAATAKADKASKGGDPDAGV